MKRGRGRPRLAPGEAPGDKAFLAWASERTARGPAALSMPEAAAALGVSRQMCWRRLRSLVAGKLIIQCEPDRWFVPKPTPSGAKP